MMCVVCIAGSYTVLVVVGVCFFVRRFTEKLLTLFAYLVQYISAVYQVLGLTYGKQKTFVVLFQ